MPSATATLTNMCPLCEDSGYQRNALNEPTCCTCSAGQERQAFTDRMEAQAQAEFRRVVIARMKLPAKYQRYTLETSPLRNWVPYLASGAPRPAKQRHPYKAALAFVSPWDRHSNLLLFGKPGVGKTSLEVALMQHLVDQAARERWTMRFVYSGSLMEELRGAGRAGKTQEVIDKYQQPYLLVLDDLTDAPEPWILEHFRTLIEARVMAGRPIFLSTNCAPNELAHVLGGRMLDRLLQGQSQIITIHGPCLRHHEQPS